VILATTRQELGQGLDAAQEAGRSIGLVPTMGYLHEGHLSLIDLVGERAGFVAASIFVNPLQFGAGEDLGHYPRETERDLALLEARGVDLVFHPSVDEMYPGGDPAISVDPGPMGDLLCGASRPGHFRGVLTVVARLFGLVRPSHAAFGRKDFQQAVLIRRMVRDLEMGVEILLGDIVREEDGLAMSSRNLFLEPREREAALGLRRGLLAVEAAYRAGEVSPQPLRELWDREMEHHPPLETQYAEVVDPESLESVGEVVPGSVFAAAAYCGSTRLIDNQILGSRPLA
jgi:pantoate--beta-alanine ligase